MSAMLEHVIRYWVAGGPLLIPLAATGAGIWAYLLRTRQHYLAVLAADDAPAPSGAVDGRSLLATVAEGARADADAGCHVAEAFARREAQIVQRLRRDLVVLAGLTVAAPLLGLLGTVTGMIDTFGAVADAGSDTGSRVASGISEALITTQYGLIVALPGVVGMARLLRLLEQIRARLSAARVQLLIEVASGAGSPS